MTDHPTAHLDAERGPQPRTSPDDLPNDRAALDAAMEEHGFRREPRHREGDMVEAIARQFLAMRLKLGHTDHREPSAAVFREAMRLMGYTPKDRHNARALGRVLSAERRRVHQLQQEVASLRGELPPAGDEPTEEAARPMPLPMAPAGLSVRRPHPDCPAAKRGEQWWSIVLNSNGIVLLRCATPRALSGALDVLSCATWTDLDPEGHTDARDALSEALSLPGVSRGLMVSVDAA